VDPRRTPRDPLLLVSTSLVKFAGTYIDSLQGGHGFVLSVKGGYHSFKVKYSLNAVTGINVLVWTWGFYCALPNVHGFLGVTHWNDHPCSIKRLQLHLCYDHQLPLLDRRYLS